MKICKNCQTKQDDDAIFCMECGYTEFEEDTSSQASINQRKTSSEFDNEEIKSNISKEIENTIDLSQTQANIGNNLKSSTNIKLNMLDENENIIKTWTLGKLPSYSIGRISSMGSVDIDLSDFEDGKYVSRNHGKIYKSNGKWYYTDLGSKYGSEIITLSKREKMIPKQSYLLEKGIILILAKKIRFEVE